MTPNDIKGELLRAASVGINEYLRSTRGARLYASISVVGRHELQIKLKGEPGHGPDFYSVKITHPLEGR